MIEHITDKDLKLLNSKKGIKQLLKDENYSISKILRYVKYENKLKELQEELIKLQKWVGENDEKIVILSRVEMRQEKGER